MIKTPYVLSRDHGVTVSHHYVRLHLRRNLYDTNVEYREEK